MLCAQISEYDWDFRLKIMWTNPECGPGNYAVTNTNEVFITLDPGQTTTATERAQKNDSAENALVRAQPTNDWAYNSVIKHSRVSPTPHQKARSRASNLHARRRIILEKHISRGFSSDRAAMSPNHIKRDSTYCHPQRLHRRTTMPVLLAISHIQPGSCSPPNVLYTFIALHCVCRCVRWGDLMYKSHTKVVFVVRRGALTFYVTAKRAPSYIYISIMYIIYTPLCTADAEQSIGFACAICIYRICFLRREVPCARAADLFVWLASTDAMHNLLTGPEHCTKSKDAYVYIYYLDEIMNFNTNTHQPPI